MQIKETLSKGLKREFQITIPVGDVETKLNKRLELIGKNVKIPGFRPGKIPLPLLKQRYKAEALSEVIEDCIEQSVKKAVKEHNLRLALKPKVNLDSYDEKKDLSFQVDLEILPTLDEIKLDGFSFEKYTIDIPSDTVSDVLKNLAKRHRESRPIEKPRKSKKGDVVVIDFEGFIGKDPIEGGKGNNYSLELGSGSFIPGFEDQLIGQDKGAKVEVKLSFPKDYHEKRYADKPARFDVTIIDIHEMDPVKVDEALAKKLGFDSLDNMKDHVKQSLSTDYVAQSFLNTKRHVLDALSERFSFEIPAGMVDLEFNNIWNQLLRELGIEQNQTLSKQDFEKAAGKDEDTLRKDYKVIAERRVRLGILLAEIGNRNDISVSNQELMNALMTRAREFPGQEREVLDFYRNNESAMASIRAPLFEDKVVEFILSKSKVKETSVTPEELEKILTREEEEAEKKISGSGKKTEKNPKKDK